MNKAIRIANWALLVVILGILLISVFNHFGVNLDPSRSETPFGLIFFLPFALLVASSFIGRKHTNSALAAIIGTVLILADMMIGLPFSTGPEATWARWLIESGILFTVVSLLTRHSRRTR